MKLIFFLISFAASVIGSICGIGGGIIIKPVLDFAALTDLASIGFLSSCTVLSMSAYNVCRSLSDRSGGIDRANGTPLAIGAAIGGVLGNQAFSLLKSAAGRDGLVGAAQALLLLVLTLGTLVYTLNKARISPKNVESRPTALLIGLALGCVSSFLGIGGGPFNLVVLHYFFGMDTKKAVSNSLYVILFSQIANLLVTVLGGSVPNFDPLTLILMMAGGIGGGIIGRIVNKRVTASTVDKLFIGLMVGIMLLCVYNAYRYITNF